MAAGQQRGAGGKDRSGAIVAVLSGFLLTGAILAGVALLFPDLVSDLNIMAGSDSSETTETTVIEGSQEEAEQVVDLLVTALEAGDLTAISFAAEGPAATTTSSSEATEEADETEEDPADAVTTTTEELDAVGTAATDFAETVAGLGSYTLDLEPGTVVRSGQRATAPTTAVWNFGGDVTWTTEGRIDLLLVDGQWRVDWSPAALESSLRVGDRLAQNRVGSTRGQILGGNGEVLVEQLDLVQVGIQPSRVDDLPSLTQRLEEVLGIDGAELSGRVQAADDGAFVDVITLPRSQYDGVRDEIFPLPGTVFRETQQPASVDPNFARALLGRSGEVTAEIIEQNPGLYQPGDYVGISGLQADYNQVLTGTPGMSITVVRARPDLATDTTASGLITTTSVIEFGAPQVLFEIPAVDGLTVQTTLDPRAQRAAEAALERTTLNSALVAVRVSTGEVVALANGPTGAQVNNAAVGQYPPGSIFKVVSGYTILRDALGAADPIACPQTITVSGRTFANAENEVLGTVSFRSAFAHSCNTAFVGATDGFGNDILNIAGTDFGLGTEYNLGIGAFSGSVPVTEDEVDLAAAAFGQGRVLFSPLSAAVMAATAADGVYRSPVLITSPSPGDQVVQPLDPGPAGELQELMRAVVTEGTGRAVAGVIGAPVSGKTGTAEFGNDNPPRSHAWFVGYQGDLAFAVFVEAGEFGGSTAAPIAAQFLNDLAG